MKIEMKKLMVAGVLAGGAFLIQGCGTTMAPVDLPEDPRPMPPSVGVSPAPAKPRPPAVSEVLTPPSKPSAPSVIEAAVPSDKPAAPEVLVATKPVKVWDTSETTVYTVKKGDMVSKIAKRYGVTLAEVLALNKLKNPNKIVVGQKILLPGKIDISKPIKRSVSHSGASRQIPPGSTVYVVKKGDCLSKIAARAGVKTSELRKVNGLKSDVIFVGKKLIVPAGHKVASSSGRAVAPSKPASVVREQSPAEPESVPVVLEPAPRPADDINLDLPPEQSAGDVVSDDAAEYYTVKEGDTILSVVSEFNISIPELRDANHLDSDVLSPGQRLKIPTKE